MIEILFETIQEHREIPIRIEVLVVLHLVRVQYFTHSVSQALAMSSSKQQAFIGGAFVHKELQGFAAFVAYQKCHHSGNSVTKTMMEASIAEQYFGNTSDSDSIGLAEQLVGGIGIFGGLYYQSGTSSDYLTPVHHDHHTTNPPPLLNTTTASRSSLVMKPSLHCLGGHITIPVGGINGISLPLLLQSKLNTTASNSDDNIRPRTLFTRAQEVVKNGKKALACVMAPNSPYKDYIKREIYHRA
jgi:hypothetical protein